MADFNVINLCVDCNILDSMRNFFITIYKVIKDKYWGDPVWSKVISAGIITVLGGLTTTLYLLVKALVDKISLKEAFGSLSSFLTQTTNISNLLILVCLIFILITTVIFIIKFIKDIKQKR
ncbi:MAG TPA: hypothetical protein VHZ50_15335, partial [Puia sp.]|nr:hypothetical protein [Puia sp.]